MSLKKTMRLAGSTYPAMIQTIIIQTLLLALVVGVFSIIVYPTLTIVISLFKRLDIVHQASLIFADIAQGNFSPNEVGNIITGMLHSIKNAFLQTQELFNSVVWAYIGFLIGSFTIRFLISFTDVATGCYLCDFMNSSGNCSLVWYIFKRIGVALKYSAVQLLTTIWLDLFAIFGSIGLYLFLLTPFGAVGVILGILVFIMCFTARQTLFAFWLPEYTNNGFHVREALREAMKKVLDCYWRQFWRIALLITADFVIAILINLPGFNGGWAVLVAIISLCVNFFTFYTVKCLNFVSYYSLGKRPFYTRRLRITEQTDISSIVVE